MNTSFEKKSPCPLWERTSSDTLSLLHSLSLWERVRVRARVWVRDESGISVVLVVGVLLILSILGAVIVSVITTESETSLNEVQSTKAYYVAQGGIEYGLYTTTRGGGSWIEATFNPPRQLGPGTFILRTYTAIVSGQRRMTLESIGRVDNPLAERKLSVTMNR